MGWVSLGLFGPFSQATPSWWVGLVVWGFEALSQVQKATGISPSLDVARGIVWGFPPLTTKPPNHSRGHFPILSRDPWFQKTIRTPGETAGV